MNICGCLVHAMPECASTVSDTMSAVDGVEVCTQTQEGKIVVVVEDTPERFASETIMALHQIPGVLSLTLTYHHFETLDDLKEDQPIDTFEKNAHPL